MERIIVIVYVYIRLSICGKMRTFYGILISMNELIRHLGYTYWVKNHAIGMGGRINDGFIWVLYNEYYIKFIIYNPSFIHQSIITQDNL